MVPALYSSILLLGTVLLSGALAETGNSSPFSVLTGFQHRLSGISTFQATVERRQTYRNVHRNASGVLLYDRTIGTRYEWKNPGHYLFISMDTLVWGVDINKRCGWKSATPDNRLRRQTDPLGRLLRLQSVPPEEFSFRGNNDSLLFFSLALGRRTYCTIGIEPGSKRCRIIEYFAEKGILLEKTFFSFQNGRDSGVLPDAVIISGLYGADVAVDTIIITRRHVNATVGKKEFAFPAGITWGKNGATGCLSQKQFHPAAGR